MNNPILGIDTWEGQLEIDEATLKANNVEFMFIRLNDINGGHHKDEGFDKQWREATGFYRAPYFVYNPWVSGSANFAWLKANMPVDAKGVMPDVEVRYSGITPANYAAEVKKFNALCRAEWNVLVYTGEWFLQYLSEWDRSVSYCWAQYPYEFYPSDSVAISWDELRQRLQNYVLPSNAGKCPGPLLVWQLSGDRLILPGNTKPMDICIWMGTREQMVNFFGGTGEIPPPTGDKMEQYEVTAFINIRPSAGDTLHDLGDLLVGDIIEVDQKQLITWGSYTGNWLHITKVTRFGSGEAFYMSGWCWGKNTKLVTVTPPPAESVDVAITVNGAPVGKVTVNGQEWKKV